MSELSVKQKNAICYLLQGWKLGDVSRELGVNVRTLNRWMDDTQFNDELKRQEGLVIDAVSWQLVSLSRLAVQVLGDILDSDTLPPGSNIKRLAARDVLDCLLRWRELVDYEQRLSRLEEMTGNR